MVNGDINRVIKAFSLVKHLLNNLEDIVEAGKIEDSNKMKLIVNEAVKVKNPDNKLWRTKTKNLFFTFFSLGAFETIKAEVIKRHAPTTSLLEICKDITDDIELKCERRKTKRHLEIETLRTQRFVTTASNKRLRAEIENEATSSQSSSQQSQSSYEPNTDTSEDEIDDLLLPI
ncbi:unnamed protein product [Mucor hiemalis]